MPLFHSLIDVRPPFRPWSAKARSTFSMNPPFSRNRSPALLQPTPPASSRISRRPKIGTITHRDMPQRRSFRKFQALAERDRTGKEVAKRAEHRRIMATRPGVYRW